jgi:hypothetical protein
MPDLSQAVRVSPFALEPYRVAVAPLGAPQGAAADWFGPLMPMAPTAPKSVAGRQFDFPPGFNLLARPRGYEPIGFGELRALADSYDLIRLIDNVNFRYAGTLLGGTAMGTLTGSFGDTPTNISTTLSGSLSTGSTSCTVTSDSGFPSTGSFVVYSAATGEMMQVQAGAGSTAWSNIVRGFNGTTEYTGTYSSGPTLYLLDPDEGDTLAVDLTETAGALAAGTQADADGGNTLCLVDDELVTYEQATLTAQYQYNLGKSGSAAGYLRRGVYGTAISAHAAGASFARLRPGSYFTLGYDAGDVGKTIYVKLLSFNPWGGGRQTLEQVSAFSHTLTIPPATSAGLVGGTIQTADLALGAATNQVTASQPNHVTVSVSPTQAQLVSATLQTIGGVVQLAYNTQFINQSTSASDSVTWYLYCDNTQVDTGSVTIAASSAATIAKQATFTPAAGAHSFALKATDTTGTGFTVAILTDLSATEIRR